MALALPFSALKTGQHVHDSYIVSWIRMQLYLIEAFCSGSF
jgi:hypothetical protein